MSRNIISFAKELLVERLRVRSRTEGVFHIVLCTFLTPEISKSQVRAHVSVTTRYKISRKRRRKSSEEPSSETDEASRQRGSTKNLQTSFENNLESKWNTTKPYQVPVAVCL